MTRSGQCQYVGTKPCSAESSQSCKTFCFSEIAFPVLDYEVQLLGNGRAEWLQHNNLASPFQKT